MPYTPVPEEEITIGDCISKVRAEEERLKNHWLARCNKVFVSLEVLKLNRVFLTPRYVQGSHIPICKRHSIDTTIELIPTAEISSTLNRVSAKRKAFKLVVDIEISGYSVTVRHLVEKRTCLFWKKPRWDVGNCTTLNNSIKELVQWITEEYDLLLFQYSELQH